MGGAETMVMNIYKALDYSKIKFDFVVSGTEIGEYEKQINSKVSCVYHISKRSESLYKHLRDLYRVVKSNHYDIVHFHTQNAFLTVLDILMVKLAGVNNVVVHSHNTMDWRADGVVKLHKIFRPILNMLTTKKLSCGEDAARYLYGNCKNVEILPLPVNCEEYLFDKNKYLDLRNKYGVTGNKVIAHTGRFSDVKNHTFLIDIFNEYLKIEPNSILFLMGDGELKKEIEDKVRNLNLVNKVVFWGNVSDVNNKLIAADCFVFPSKYEGFPTVVIEAQAAGLPSIISDTITKDIKLTDLISQVSLNSSAKEWADIIYKVCEKDSERSEYNSFIKNKYDISVTVNKLMKIYGELV